jgi:Flp pilus assembly protein TadD
MTERRYWWLVVLILAVVVLVYSPALSAPYYFDDLSLYSDPAMLPGGASRVFDLARTRTLTYVSFLATFRGGGQSPALDHGVNVALFLLLISLAAYLYKDFVGRRAALVAVVVAALHPIATEPTIYVFSRATLLAALFAVAAWAAWVHRRHWLAVGLAFLAMSAKEEAVVLPLFFACFELMYRRQSLAQLKKLATPLGAMAASAVFFAGRVLYAARVTPESGALIGLEGVTPLTYFQAQGKVLWLYAKLMIWPTGLNFDHTISVSPGLDPLAVFGWLLIVSGAVACILWSRRWPILFLPIGALIFLAPTSTIAPLGDIAAERRMLLPLLCLAPLIGYLAAHFFKGRPLAAGVSVLACLLGGVTYSRAVTWQNAERLWGDTVAKSPTKARPKLHLAGALAERGAITDQQREVLLREAVDVEPWSAGAWGELGFFLLQRYRTEEATDAWQTAYQLAPNDPTLAVNLGVALANDSKFDEAEVLFRTVLDQYPCHFDARNNLLYVLRSREELETVRALAIPPSECILPEVQMEALSRAAGL